MKQLLLILIPLCTLTLYSQELTNIHELQNSSKFKLEATSNGDYTGECVNLKINYSGIKDMEVQVPAGTIFEPKNEDEQTIFVIEDQDFFVEKGESNVMIKGYCSEASDKAPTEGDPMRMSVTTNKDLLALAKFTSGKSYDDNVNSNAVWAVSDKRPVANIYNSPKTEEVTALREEVAKISGQKEVWYNTNQELVLDENRNIVATPVSLEGTLSAEISKPGIVRYAVYDANGLQKSTKSIAMNLPRAGIYDLKFSLKVEGWEEGTYTVKIIFDGRPIHEKDFEV